VESTINFDSVPSALFLEGDYLAVFGTEYTTQQNSQNDLSSKRAYYSYQPQSANTYVHVYDVSRKSNPTLIKEYKVEGRYTNGRMTENGFVYLISSLNCNNRQDQKDTAPWYNFNGRKQYLRPNEIFYYPGSSEDYQGANFLNIFTFNLGNPRYAQENIVSVIGQSSHLIYMSEKNIYLTATRYLNSQQKTSIHKIFVWRNMIIPFADGTVNGTLNNQFSMDEYKGDLRVATTQSVFINRRT
jgi:inhibitor of cysteine peptidase